MADTRLAAEPLLRLITRLPPRTTAPRTQPLTSERRLRWVKEAVALFLSSWRATDGERQQAWTGRTARNERPVHMDRLSSNPLVLGNVELEETRCVQT